MSLCHSRSHIASHHLAPGTESNARSPRPQAPRANGACRLDELLLTPRRHRGCPVDHESLTLPTTSWPSVEMRPSSSAGAWGGLEATLAGARVRVLGRSSLARRHDASHRRRREPVTPVGRHDKLGPAPWTHQTSSCCAAGKAAKPPAVPPSLGNGPPCSR
jgi:hypothetical protein